MNVSESNDWNTVLAWAMGLPGHDGRPIREQDANDAARRLTVKSHKTLMAGLRPEQVRLGAQLVAEGAGPLVDPDCRDGKCGSCVGPPCEHDCHREGAAW